MEKPYPFGMMFGWEMSLWSIVSSRISITIRSIKNPVTMDQRDGMKLRKTNRAAP